MGFYSTGELPNAIIFIYYGRRYMFGPGSLPDHLIDYSKIVEKYKFDRKCNNDYTPVQLVRDFIQFYNELPEDVKNVIIKDNYHDSYKLDFNENTACTLETSISFGYMWMPQFISPEFIEYLENILLKKV